MSSNRPQHKDFSQTGVRDYQAASRIESTAAASDTGRGLRVMNQSDIAASAIWLNSSRLTPISRKRRGIDTFPSNDSTTSIADDGPAVRDSPSKALSSASAIL